MKKKVLSCILCAATITSMCGCSGNSDSSAVEQQTSTDTTTTANTSGTAEMTTSQPVDDTPAVTPDDVKLDGQVRVSPLNASTTNGGSFEGWGTSLCWWANRIGYSDSLSQQAADLFFGDEGLDLNIMRYNIGGGDDPTHHHITRTDSAVPGWLVLDEATGEYIYRRRRSAERAEALRRSFR